MIKDVGNFFDIENCNKILNEDGAFCVRGFLKEQEISSLKNETIKLCTIDSYKFGKPYRGPQLSKHGEIVKGVFDRKWMRDLYKLFSKSDGFGFGCNIFATHDYLSNNGIEVNGHLHFDKLRKLKFFIYLTDVNSKKDGPLTICAGSSNLSKSIRLKACNKNVTKSNIKNKVFFDFEKMDVPDLIKRGVLKKISLLYVDVNLYQPSLKVMNDAWDVVAKGGIVAIDEHLVGGETRAIKEFAKEKNIELKYFKDIGPSYYLVKL